MYLAIIRKELPQKYLIQWKEESDKYPIVIRCNGGNKKSTEGSQEKHQRKQQRKGENRNQDFHSYQRREQEDQDSHLNQ